GMGGRALRDRVADLIERFRLSDVADRLVQTYSGGMQRKLDLAMGLVHRPRVLFLDEPTTGLDPEARADLWEEIARLTREDGVTVLLTTHYLDEADRLAQRLAIVDRGRVVIEGSPEQLKGELHGDTVHIELERRAANAQASAVVQQVGLTDVVVDGRWLRARASHGASALPAVLAALEAHGVRAISATVARPSLDDVYLRYAGRRFDQANQEDVR
ncbi:MAG TPA: ATP-binding cassette domain-containing protein, partial [Chloroflexota bacterium]